MVRFAGREGGVLVQGERRGTGHGRTFSMGVMSWGDGGVMRGVAVRFNDMAQNSGGEGSIPAP